MGRGRGRGREEGACGRQVKGIGRSVDDAGARGMGGGRGRGGSLGRSGGNKGTIYVIYFLSRIWSIKKQKATILAIGNKCDGKHLTMLPHS